jgi:glycosyltransferase involved in cell wall biosynthesis
VPAVPRVSICLPVYNGGAWIEQAIASACAQTFEDFELIVCDDASTDDTLVRVAAFDDSRIRVVRSDRNRGQALNANRCIELARGPLVKFLHADDVLYCESLEAMVPIFDEFPRVGLVFSPRDVLLDEPGEEESRSWYERYHTLHAPLGDLARVTSGRRIFRRWLEIGVHDNLIGEPSVVLVRRECFQRLGSFDPRLHVSSDIEMWLRIVREYDVGFLPEPLCAYRHHAASVTGAAARTSSSWLDDLWIMESLLQRELDASERALVLRARRAELRRVTRGLPARLARRDATTAGLRQYLRHRLRSVVPG